MSVRPSYRARLCVVALDIGAEAALRGVGDREDLRVMPLDAGTGGALVDSDMVLFFSSDASAVHREELVAVASTLRERGLLVGGVVTGAVAVAEGTADERAGLAALREAVDMLVVVRDEVLVLDLLEVLRGGREDPQPAG